MTQYAIPITLLDPTTAAVGTNSIAGNPSVVSINLTISGSATKITLVQNSTAQDESLRVWVSLTAGGAPITPIITVGGVTQKYVTPYWHAAQNSANPFVIFSATAGHGTQANFSGASGVFYVLVPDGVCYVNVENLVNTTNTFTFAQASP